MITVSDNSASDLVFAAVGGAHSVQRRLDQLGYKHTSVDRAMRTLIADFDRDEVAFLRDSRDTSTASEITDFLAALFSGKLLSEGSTAHLASSMKRCETGTARLAGLLEPQVKVFHKTGTLGRIVNDAGVIELTDGSRFAITVLLCSTQDEPPDLRVAESVIARIGKAAYEHFSIHTSSQAA